NFFKCQRNLDPKIGTPGTPAAGPFLSTKERTKRTAASKNISELVKNIFHRTSTRTSKATLTVHPGVPKPVITGSFVRITQYLVSFCCFFEFFFCFGVSRVFIGLVLHRDFAVGFLNNVAVGSLFYCSCFVMIYGGHVFIVFPLSLGRGVCFCHTKSSLTQWCQ